MANKTHSTLPLGLSIVVSQTVRNFQYNLRNSDVVSGDASLHGLYSSSVDEDGEITRTVENTVIETPFSTAEPGTAERKNFANNCMYLPQVIANAGFSVLSERVDLFYKAANKTNDNLKRNIGRVLTPDRIKALEDQVNQYATKCIELKIKCVRVTKDNPKGSHKRSDGLFAKTSTLRTVYIDNALSNEQITSLINNVLMKNEIVGTASAATYQVVSDNGDSVYLRAKVDRTTKTSF